MRVFYCKKCGASGTRQMIKKHLKEEHFLGKKQTSSLRGNFFSKGDGGTIREYERPKDKK